MAFAPALDLTTLFEVIFKNVSSRHGGRRQPMCDPEGCATVLGAVGGRGEPPPPWLTQTLGVGGSGAQPPGSPGGGGYPNIHTSK